MDPPETRLRRANELVLRGGYEQPKAELTALLREAEKTGPAGLQLGILSNLAVIEAEMERYSQAERLYLRSGQVWEQLPPAQRTAEVDPRLDLLSLYVQAGWLKKAERIAGEVTVAASRKQQIRALDGIGNLRCGQKRFAEAIEYYRQAIALAGDEGDEGTAGSLWNSLGVALARQRRLDEAVEAFERALSHGERAWGNQQPVLIATLTNIGGTCLDLNRLERAASALARARDLAEKTLGPSYPGLYRVLILQSRAFERAKCREEAKAARRKAEMLRSSLNSKYTIDISDLPRQ